MKNMVLKLKRIDKNTSSGCCLYALRIKCTPYEYEGNCNMHVGMWWLAEAVAQSNYLIKINENLISSQ